MIDSIPGGAVTLLVAAAACVAGAVVVLKLRRGSAARSVQRVVKTIAFESSNDLVIPNADGGEIQIDYLILTAEGLVVIDVKEVRGKVFGSDKCRSGP